MDVFFDSAQEADWFLGLHPILSKANISPFPSKKAQGILAPILVYDRPDIVLCDEGQPILVLERTIEVPSGHNVGQRFGRICASAEAGVPFVYFGPYAAYKHGGPTQGPRFMNLRLFQALDRVQEITGTSVVTINWPVDRDYEILKTPSKDSRIKEYLQLFFQLYNSGDRKNISEKLKGSKFSAEQRSAIKDFVESEVRRADDYDAPPESVTIAPAASIPELRSHSGSLGRKPLVFYRVGMTNVRSDPYTGMAMLYAYLYCGGMKSRSHKLILHFPHISLTKWRSVSGSDRKDVRIFKLVSDAILFGNELVLREDL